MTLRWAGLLLLVVAAGCHREVAGGKADGPAIFQEACARCHGDGGKPSESMKSQLNVRDLTSEEFGARASVELIENQVRKGSSNGVMPAFAGTLKEEQIRAVAAYVMTLH